MALCYNSSVMEPILTFEHVSFEYTGGDQKPIPAI